MPCPALKMKSSTQRRLENCNKNVKRTGQKRAMMATVVVYLPRSCLIAHVSFFCVLPLATPVEVKVVETTVMFFFLNGLRFENSLAFPAYVKAMSEYNLY